MTGAPADDDAPIEYLLYEMTFTVANATGADVFRVFEQETEEVINVFNYLIERGKRNKVRQEPKLKMKSKGDIFWDYV